MSTRPRRRGISKEVSRGNGRAEESPVGGESSLNVNKAAGQGEMERKIKKCVHS